MDVEELNNFERAILAKKQQGEKVYCETCWLGVRICPFRSTLDTDVLCLKGRCALWSGRRCGLVEKPIELGRLNERKPYVAWDAETRSMERIQSDADAQVEEDIRECAKKTEDQIRAGGDR
jgi:hypothetical protein